MLQAAALTENQTGSASRTAAHRGGDGNLYDRNYCRQCSNVVCSLWPSKTCTGRYGRTKINSLMVADPAGEAKSLFLRLQGLMIFSFFLSESTPIGTAGQKVERQKRSPSILRGGVEGMTEGDG